MLKYQDFLSDKMLESSINESAIYYMDDFKEKLKAISGKNKIAKELLDLEKYDVGPDMTFISLGPEDGEIKFSQINKVVDHIKKWYQTLIDKTSSESRKAELGELRDSNISDLINGSLSSFLASSYFINTEVQTKSRNVTSLGRLVNKFLPGKFSDKERDDFVNLFKANLQSDIHFEIVSGEDIKFWYLETNYYDNDGELGSSCMRYSKCQNYLKIYTENPNVCQMLIYKEGKKIKGRALIWKIEGFDKSEYFMDRIYTTEPAIKKKFEEWCDKKGYLRKYASSADMIGYFIWKGSDYELDIQVKLEKFKFEKYPYMDTFKRLRLKDGTLHNDNDDDVSGCYILRDTGGRYEDTSGKFSHYFDEYIPNDRAVYSSYLNDWIWADEAVEVIFGRYDGWYPAEHGKLTSDPFRGWLNIDDTVYSDYYGENIYANDAVSVIVHFEFRLSNGKIYYSQETLSSQDSQIVDGYSLDCYDWLKKSGLYDLEFSTDILNYSNVTGKYYFEDYEISVYNTELGDLSEVDAQLYGVEYKSSFSHRTDIMSYNHDVEDKIGLQKKLEDKIKELEYNLSGQQTKLKFSQAQEEMLETNQKQLLEKFKKRLSELKLFL